MRVRLRNPDRQVEVEGPRLVRDLLSDLAIDPDTVLVIRDRTLVTRGERLADADEVEIRPVISGEDRQVLRELSEEVLPAEMYGGGA